MKLCCIVFTLFLLLLTFLPSAHAGTEFTDHEGRTLRFSAPPERIISLSPANTEIVYYLGLADRLAGVTTYCNYPPEVAEKDVIGSITEVDLEAVVRLAPALVLASSLTPDEAVTRLTELGLDVFVLEPRTIEEIFESMEIVSLIAHHPQGLEKVESLREEAGEVLSLLEGLEEEDKPSVLHLIWHDPVWTVGGDTFVGHLINRAGGHNLTGELSGYVTLDLEEVLRRNPEIITVVDDHGAAENLPYEFVMSDSRLGATSARENGRVHRVSSDIVSRSGPRVVEALRLFASLFHPARVESHGALELP